MNWTQFVIGLLIGQGFATVVIVSFACLKYIKILRRYIRYFLYCPCVSFKSHLIHKQQWSFTFSALAFLPLVVIQRSWQSRSQSMPVRGLCSGMTLGKSNRNRYLIGCRDHWLPTQLMRVFLRELRVDIREVRIIWCLSDLECEIKQYKSKDIILIVWKIIGTLGIYLQNGMVFMNDFLSIYSMSILYVETTA
jgi:hypothetical protein